MKRRSSKAEPTSRHADAPRSSVITGLLLGGLVALMTATPLLPSETVRFGAGTLTLLLLWLVLFLAWTLAGVAGAAQPVRAGVTLVFLVLFLAWHTLSAVVMAGEGQPRAALNMAWQWIGVGMTFFLSRQLVRSQPQQRAVIAVMMGLAVCLSVVGLYQYFYELPRTRAEYARDPDRMLREAGVVAPEGSAQRILFEKRLQSVEPFATFALTNSLAGFLAPWLIMILATLVTSWRLGAASWRFPMALAIAAIVVAGCELLTKSRAAFVAVTAGIVLLLCSGWRLWRLDWRWLAGGGAAMVLLVFLAYSAGGLDQYLVVEAGKAMLYRFQYWQATAQLIGDYPWFGCGPGNFQQYYTAYKLPQASEIVADPHNFVAEIWATAGTPAVVLFLGFLGTISWKVCRTERHPRHEGPTRAATEARHQYRRSRTGRAEPEEDETRSFGPAGDQIAWIYGGGLAGVLVGYSVCSLLEYPPSLSVLVLGLPLAVLFVLACRNWVNDGVARVVVPAIAGLVLLINFVAAGGIGFGGVAQSLWILAAIVMNRMEDAPGAHVSRRSRILLAVAGLAGIFAFAHFGYFRQLEKERLIAAGDAYAAAGHWSQSLDPYRQAGEADPLAPEGWESLSLAALRAWTITGEAQHQQTFHWAAEQLLSVNSRSYAAHAQVGDGWLTAYRRFGNRQFLDEAIAEYRIAATLYPNYNLGRAQLAWSLYLAGDSRAAEREAVMALRLNDLNPHGEQDLSQRRLYDPGGAHADQLPSPGDENAEQVMQRLRNAISS